MQFAIADLFECVADHVPERVAVVEGGRRVTYRELDERANQCAHALGTSGVAAHEHVGLYLHDSIEHLEALLGVFKMRAVPINVNYRYVAAELEHVARDGDLVAVVHDAALRDRVDGAVAASPVRVWIEVGGEPDPDRGGSAPFEQLVAEAPSHRMFGPRSGDDRYILYTGGTTGMPRGVLWRQEDIFFAALGGGNPGGAPIAVPEELGPSVLANPNQRLTAFLPPGDAGPGEFVAMALGPLVHASGQWLALGTLLGGGTLVLAPGPPFDPESVLELVERERVGMLTLVGDATGRPLLEALRARPGARDTSSLRLLGSGGSILSPDVKDGLLAALPSVAAVLEAIGSSEAPAQGIALAKRGGGPSRALRFAPKDDTIVLDDDLVPVAPGSGRIGRLATRGRVPLGYYKDAARTAERFVEHAGARWVLPGDMATVDHDGTIVLLGRGSLCINTGGEKVYPEEVEAVLKAHPSVADAVVVGVPDARFGERVCAVVAPASASEPPAPESIAEHCRGLLAGYKVPRTVVMVPQVRRSPAGKADYGWARDLLLAAR